MVINKSHLAPLKIQRRQDFLPGEAPTETKVREIISEKTINYPQATTLTIGPLAGYKTFHGAWEKSIINQLENKRKAHICTASLVLRHALSYFNSGMCTETLSEEAHALSWVRYSSHSLHSLPVFVCSFVFYLTTSVSYNYFS